MKRTLGACAAGAALLLTGCTATVSGRAVPADTDGPLPPPLVTITQLDSLLPRAVELDGIVDATGMEVKTRISQMWDDSPNLSDPGCVDVWLPVEAPAYDGTGWTAMRAQQVADGTPDTFRHYVAQAVVAFPTADEAQAFFDTATQTWADCANRRVQFRKPGKPASSWTHGDLTASGDTLTMPQTREAGDGWSCQRARSVYSNVIVDAVVCGFDITDQAATLVAAVTDKMPKA